VVISGSIKTILSGGGGYGTLTSLVNANSGIYEGSTMSTMAIAMIPLVVWVARFSTVFPKHWTTWVFTGALVFACLLIPVGTQTRTGLICIGVLGVLVLRFARHRFLIAGAAAFVMMIAMPFLPESYTERMATITDHQSDTSASTRVAVWYWTLDYAKSNPMGGGFNSYLGNSFTYKTRTTVQDGGTTHVEYEDVTDEGRAFHSAYFELLGEQGWPGLALWLWIQLLGLWHMERIYRQFRKQEDRVSKSYASLAVALQQGQIIYLVGATFVGIGYQPYAFMFVGLQIGLTSLVARHQTEKREANRRNVAANRGVRAQGSQMALKPLRET
jgi:O-antigen ligase